MSCLKSSPKSPALIDLFDAFPETSHALLQFHEVLLPRPLPLTIAQQETITALVSGSSRRERQFAHPGQKRLSASASWARTHFIAASRRLHDRGCAALTAAR